MIKDVKYWEEWEREYIRSQPVDVARNIAIFDAMYQHARAIGAVPPADPMEGIEVKIRIARALNVHTPDPKDRR
jgi:hypothetical protein